MEEENLVTRRSKRSTAGNRMQAALAEIASEDTSKEDLEEDKDFVVETYEEDAFESDFQSTDEDEAGVEQESAVDNEEKQTRKAARSRLERATAAAHARQQITFNPTAAAEASISTSLKSKPRRRVSLAFAIDAQTGQVILENEDEDGDKDDGDDSKPTRKRSKRQTTIQNTTDAVKRYLKSEEKKASQPRKRLKSAQKFTQAQLLARALDTEEGNLVDHRDYLRLEEEKRELRAKRDKVAVTGPLLKFVSKVEEIKVEEMEEVKRPQLQPSLSSGYVYNPHPHSFSAYGPMSAATVPPTNPASTSSLPTANPVPATPATPGNPPFLVLTPTTLTQPKLAPAPVAPRSNSLPKPSTKTGDLPFLWLDPTTKPNAQSKTSSASGEASFLWLEPNTVQSKSKSTSTSTQPTTPKSTAPAANGNAPFLWLAPTVPPAQTSTTTATPSSSSFSAPSYTTYLYSSNPENHATTTQRLSSTPAFPASVTAPVQGPPPVPAPLPSAGMAGTVGASAYVPAPSFQVPAQPPPPVLKKTIRTEKASKSYVVHELSQDDEDDPKPDWESTMEAMFGTQVKWGEVKVYTEKNRPLTRYIPTCAITGAPAQYLDPRTGVPYANVKAYTILRRLTRSLIGTGTGPGTSDVQKTSVELVDRLQNGNDLGGFEVAWDEELGCYVENFVGSFDRDVDVKGKGREKGEQGISMMEKRDEDGRMVIDLT